MGKTLGKSGKCYRMNYCDETVSVTGFFGIN